MDYEPITFERECEVIQIPDGYTMLVAEETSGIVMQVLGGNFTLRLATGYLVRVNGKDGDAIGKEPALPAPVKLGQDGELTEEAVWEQLKACYDPEIPMNIVELGLIYSCGLENVDDGTMKVNVEMTLTAPGCGMGQILVDDVENAVSSLPNVSEAVVDLVFDPPWDPSRMSEVARLELGFG